MGCITVANLQGQVTSKKHKFWIIGYDVLLSMLVVIPSRLINRPQSSQVESSVTKDLAVKGLRDLLVLWEKKKGYLKGKGPEIKIAAEKPLNSKRVSIPTIPYTPTTPDAITQLNRKEKKKSSNESSYGQVGSKIVIEKLHSKDLPPKVPASKTSKKQASQSDLNKKPSTFHRRYSRKKLAFIIY